MQDLNAVKLIKTHLYSLTTI